MLFEKLSKIYKQLGNNMTADTIVELIKKIIDISLVWLLIYYVLKALKNSVKKLMVFKIIIIIIIIKLISMWLGLVTVGYIINYVIELTPIALIIIFQPEIRETFEQMGQTKLVGKHKILSTKEQNEVVDQIIIALDALCKQKVGALIIIERNDSLSTYIERGQKIQAKVTAPLLTSLFYNKGPLSDGAVVIQGNQITCSNTYFPTSSNINLSKRLGSRHRAALGIAEQADSMAIVLSEETGRISLAVNNQLIYNITFEVLKKYLLQGYKSTKKIISEHPEVTNRG